MHQPAHRFVLSVPICFLAVGCSSAHGPKGACEVTADCPAGHVCESHACYALCASDLQCGSSQICTSGVCVTGARSDSPHIASVDGDSSLVCPNADNSHCLHAGLVVTGDHLLGAAFELDPSSGQPYELTVRQGATDSRTEIDLPTDVGQGTYDLVATNAAGSADQQLQLLQGEPGADFSPSADDLVDMINTSSKTIDAPRVTGTLSCSADQALTVTPAGGFACATVPAIAAATGACAGSGDVGRLRWANNRFEGCTPNGWVALAAVPDGSSAEQAAASCEALLTSYPNLQGADGTYWLDPDGRGPIPPFQAYCDMTSNGGGWTLVVATHDANAYAAGNAIWHDATPSAASPTPTTDGKSLAYGNVFGNQLLLKTHDEQPGYWTIFDMPAVSTLLGLVGTTNISSVAVNSPRAAITVSSSGANAHSCLTGTWNVTWRDYASSDNVPDSSIMAPATLTASRRPCGGTTAYATGIGVRTDTSNGFSGYGGSAEGLGGDTGGNADLPGGSFFIYIR